jgi:hypothetical protein
MTGFDAAFLALACSFLVKTGKQRSRTALTPLVVFLIRLIIPDVMIQQPLIVAAVIVLSGPQLAAAAVLALPAYGTIYDAAAVAILWWTLSELMDLIGGGHGPILHGGKGATAPLCWNETPSPLPGSVPGKIQHQDGREYLPHKVMITSVLYLILYPLALL